MRGGELRLRRPLQDSGGEYHDEVDIEGRPVDPAQARHLGRELAPQHVDGEGVAEAEAEVARHLFRQRDQRRPVMVRGPPFAGNDLRARRRVGGVGEADVALHHPFRAGRDLGLSHRHAVDTHDPAAQHRHAAAVVGAGGLGDQPFEGRDLVFLNVEEKEGRPLAFPLLADLGAEIALDQRDRHQHREPGAERHRDGDGGGARPAQIGEAESERRQPPRAGPPRQDDHEGRRRPEDRERRRRAEHEAERDAGAGRGGDRDAGERAGSEHRAGDGRERRPARSRRGSAAEEHARPDPRGPAEGPEREGEHRERAIGRRQPERRAVDNACKTYRQGVAHDRGEHGRGCGADDEPGRDGAEPERAQLQQEGALHRAARRAHALERRDGVQLAVQVAGDGAGDTDPAHEQGREPGEGEEQADAVELAPERGVGVAHVAQPPDGVGKGGLQPGRPVRDRRRFRNQSAVTLPHQGAGLDQPGFPQRCVIHH